MLKRSSLSFTLFLLLSDLGLTDLALYLSRELRLVLGFGKDVGSRGEWLYFDPLTFAIVTVIWLIIFTMLPVYDRRRTLRTVDDLQIVTQAAMVAFLVSAGVAYFFYRDFSRLLFFYFFLLDLILLWGWRILLRLVFKLGRAGWPREHRRVLIVGAGEVGYRVGALLQEHAWTGLELVGYLDDDPAKGGDEEMPWPILGTLDDVAAVVRSRGIQEIVVALPLRAHLRVKELVAALHDSAAQIRVVPDYFDFSQIKTGIEEFGGMPLVSLREPAMDEFQRLAKRVFDLVVGALSLVVGAPVMLLIAFLIRLDSPGPIFFTQERLGEKGRRFQMLKFRSMVQNAEQLAEQMFQRDEKGNLLFKSRDDPRVTRVGRILRRTSLDELPQLFNVLKGEMSLVGPRPEMPWVVDEYEPWQYQRFAVPQGITGWWQVNGRSDKPMHLHTEEDLYYIKNYSLLLDVIILWKTVGAVFKRKGAF
jgi:exopolysaccharide biosynthesis polyprenyl glycosylphosphotransferase